MRYQNESLAIGCLLLTLLLTGCHSLSKRAPQPGDQSARVRAWSEAEDEASLEQAAQAHAHYGAAVIHELNGEREAALREFEAAVENDPDNESLILEISERLLQSKKPERALAIVNRGLEANSTSGLLYARKGLICAQLGRMGEAFEANRMAIRKAPQSLTGYQNLFFLNLRQQNQKEALEVLDEASGQDRGLSPEFLVGLAELYTAYGQQAPGSLEETKGKALGLLSRAKELHPEAPLTQVSLAEQFYRLGDSTNAAKVYLELLKNVPDVPGIVERIHARLSEIYLRAEDHQRAAEQLQALVEQDPTNPQANYFLGAIALEAKKPLEAIDYFKKTILLKPDFEQAYYDLVNAQLAADRPADALGTLDDARRRFSQTFMGEFLAGAALARQKAWAEAIQRYTSAEIIARATDTNRLNQFLYFQLGAAYERSGDYSEAEKQFEKCLQLAPDFTEAMNYLGYMWAERGTNLDRAKELIEKAVKAEPKNAAYLDSLGWVFFKQGHADQALPYILDAVRFSEEPDATLQDHLGDVYSALGQGDKAREAWQKSLAIESNETVRKKLPPAETGPADPHK